MKIKIITQIDKEDYYNAMQIIIDDEEVFHVYDGEPEDSNLSRNFNDVYKIPDLLQKAYNAGVKGIPFKIVKY